MMDLSTIINGLRRIAQLRGVMPGHDCDLIEEAACVLADLEISRMAHLLTMEELRALPVGSVVWEEYDCPADGERGSWIEPALIRDSGYLSDNASGFVHIDDITLDRSPGGWCFRYWSTKPTEEQRRKTPWPK